MIHSVSKRVLYSATIATIFAVLLQIAGPFVVGRVMPRVSVPEWMGQAAYAVAFVTIPIVFGMYLFARTTPVRFERMTPAVRGDGAVCCGDCGYTLLPDPRCPECGARMRHSSKA